MVLSGCSGPGGLSDAQRTFCDQKFGNVMQEGANLGIVPTDLAGNPDMNQVATWSYFALGAGSSPYDQMVADAKNAWQAQHPDTYARACAQAVAKHAPK